MTISDVGRTVLAYSAPPGTGGLGHHVAGVIEALRPLFPGLRAFGPPAEAAPGSARLQVTAPPTLVPDWRWRYTWFRYMTGTYREALDSRWGRWLAGELAREPYEQAYFFTQIAREALAVARDRGARTILDNPNGHIRDFRERLCTESERWTGWPYWGHPSESMVARVEEEYRLADRIRVSSGWAKRSLVERGVASDKVFVVPQGVDLERFRPVPKPPAAGPLRLVFVGSFSLGKGFPYLLRAISRVGAARVSLEMVGATGDIWSRRLLDRLKTGLAVTHAAGDPLGAYQRGELFVLPTLHDGFGLVVAEAMACGLPIITTDACGAAEWIVLGQTGWVLPAGDEEALTSTLEEALARRHELADMGQAAHRASARLNQIAMTAELQRHVSQQWQVQPASV